MEQTQNKVSESGAGAPVRTLETSVSFITGSVLLVIALVVGGFYMMNSIETRDGMNEAKMMMEESAMGTSDELAAAEATAALTTQSSSDELGSIEADLSATDLDSLGAIDDI